MERENDGEYKWDNQILLRNVWKFGEQMEGMFLDKNKLIWDTVGCGVDIKCRVDREVKSWLQNVESILKYRVDSEIWSR